MSAKRPDLPILPETTQNRDTIQQFFYGVTEWFTGEPLCLRRSDEGLAIRVNGHWRVYGRLDDLGFWRDAMSQAKPLAESNWSTKRLRELWHYFNAYAPELTFANRRFFELRGAVLNGVTGELDKSRQRHLTCPTLRHSHLDYQPDYQPTEAWRQWHTSMDTHQERVRRWSVGSAVLGEPGLLFTYGNTRSGKSTLAEGLQMVLGSGARSISLSRDWGRFYTSQFLNTTYLFDPDAKGAKNQNNTNYGTLHMLASGDEIQMEDKGGKQYRSNDYGFVEVVSNNPATTYFEASLVDRVRFCLYTYIKSRGDGGRLKRLILADEQAWLNYAIECAMDVASGRVERPSVDEYQMLGWVGWLREANSYCKMCIDNGALLSYQQYKYEYNGMNRYMLTTESVEDSIEGIQELERHYGGSFLDKDWRGYERLLAEEYEQDHE